MGKIGNVSLAGRVRIEKSYADSAEFMEKVGKWVEERGMFVPFKASLDQGVELEVAFHLDNGRPILEGTASLVKREDGTGSKPVGLWLKWVDITERSRKNIVMIQEWRDAMKAARQA